MNRCLIVRVCSAAAAWAALLGGASAAVLHSTTFDGDNDTQPAGWTVLNGDVGPSSGWRLQNGDYRYDVTSSFGLSAYTGPLSGGVLNADLQNYTVVTDLRRGAAGYSGLVGRLSDGDNFYHMRVIRVDGLDRLQLFRFDENGSQQLGGVTLSANSAQWRVAMTFDGPNITARVFEPNGVFRGEISVVDAVHAVGGAGLRAINATAYENFVIKTPALLAYDGFHTTPDGAGASYADGALLGGANEPRVGFSGNWAPAGPSSGQINFRTLETGLSGFGLNTSPGAMEFYRSDGNPNPSATSISRSLNYQIAPEDDVWGSFLFSLDGFSGNAALAVILDGAGNHDLTFRFTTAGDGPGAQLEVRGGGSPQFSHVFDEAIAVGETNLIVFRAAPSLDAFNDGVANGLFYDTISLWLNPDDVTDLGAPDAEIYSVFRNQGANVGEIGAMDQLLIRSADAPAGFSFIFDEFRLGTSAAMVLPVPEPSAWALSVGGLLGAALLARRRRGVVNFS